MPKIRLHDDSFAIVDDQDAEKLSLHKWHVNSGYPTRSERTGKVTKHIFMHTQIIGQPPDGMVTDHKNRNRRDNRRSNLRFVSKAINAYNSKRETVNGVYWHKKAKKWAITLSHADKTLYFGLFKDEAEARSIAALLKGALMYHELTKGG
jgi:hypothetical protein